jgi:hypothetical protein
MVEVADRAPIELTLHIVAGVPLIVLPPSRLPTVLRASRLLWCGRPACTLWYERPVTSISDSISELAPLHLALPPDEGSGRFVRSPEARRASAIPAPRWPRASRGLRGVNQPPSVLPRRGSLVHATPHVLSPPDTAHRIAPPAGAIVCETRLPMIVSGGAFLDRGCRRPRGRCWIN